MNKIAKILAVAVCMVLLLAGCGQKVETKPPEVELSENAENSSASETTAEASEEVTSPQEEGDNSPENNEITFTEVVAVDNAECLIKITGIDADDFWGYTLKVQLENKSADKTYMFSTKSTAINGVECDSLFAEEVAPGKKSNEEITFSGDDLEENGVGDYTDIELTFRVYDSNDWMADEVALETVHVYPYGEDKAVKFVRESQPTDNVIIDNEYVTVIVTSYEENDIWGYTANVYLVNKIDKNIMFSVDDASVNGFMADPFFAKSVSAGKCAFGSISWSDTTLEENNITEIEKIEFTLRAYDADDWLADDFANEIITLNP